MKCPNCNDTEILTAKGICQVFLLPKLLYFVLALLSLIAAFFLTPYLSIAAMIFLLLPLAQADLRLYLFLPVFLAHLAGKKVNCPKCNPGSCLFRSGYAASTGKDKFMDE